MGKIEPRSMRALTVQSAEEALTSFLRKKGHETSIFLARLWECWDMVMGQELASLAIPLGRRGTTLIVGGEDAMALQELSMQKKEMLERANAFTGAFLDEPAFTRVQVEHLMGREGLNRPRAFAPVKMPPSPLSRPANLGRLAGVLDPEGAVGKCYAAYLAYFARQESAGPGRDE